MITIDEARRLILDRARPLAAHNRPLDEAVGQVLAEPSVSDIDSPPYDKSLMDGYAIRTGDLHDKPTLLNVIGQVTAGQVPTSTVQPGTAMSIMTGAPIPQGADAVVMREETSNGTTDSGPTVEIHAVDVAVGRNILRRASSLRRSATIAQAGHLLRAKDVGLFSEAGCRNVSVIRQARAAVVATGNELVPHEQSPRIGQIRNSNGPMLTALATEHGAQVANLGICRDEPRPLAETIREGLKRDLLILSGGVSAGVLDLVPPELERQRVQRVFHRVAVKPGKPLWFGTFCHGNNECSQEGRTLVFALPGNPLASLVCFQLFVLPALRQMQGLVPAAPDPLVGQLACDYQHKGNRPTYVPSYVEQLDGGQLAVTPLRWRGSADQSPVASANGLACFPVGKSARSTGETVELVPLVSSLPRA